MKLLASILMILVYMFFPVDCSALSVGTHHDINSYILNNTSSFDSTLKNYNIPEGIGKRFKAINPATHVEENLLITEIIANGGITEDTDGFLRYANHYHNPLKPWNSSGYIGWACDSDPVWAQNGGVYSNSYSWPSARQYLYDALIATDEDTRNTNFVNCFRSIGQVMHLVEDMSVPAHVREDSHIKGNIYEIWVDYERQHGRLNQYLSINSPDPSVIRKGFNGYATIPIAGLFDNDQYDGTNPDVTTGAVGIAEYANANFLSEDSMFGQLGFRSFLGIPDAFPYPAISSTELRKVDGREYYVKVRDGENSCGHYSDNGYLLATHGYLGTYATKKMNDLVNVDTQLFNTWFQADLKRREHENSPALDDYCYEDYATKLLPRAVGYSKALLQYFFRGDIDPGEPSVTKDADEKITGMKMKVKNKTPKVGSTSGEIEPIGEGSDDHLVVSYQYKSGSNTVYGKTGTLPFNNYSGHTYDFTGLTSPIPHDATDKKYMLVYRGKLGEEDDAVAGKSFKTFIIDDWENGQVWTAQDTRSALSIDTNAPYQEKYALHIDIASGPGNHVRRIYDAAGYSSQNLGTGYGSAMGVANFTCYNGSYYVGRFVRVSIPTAVAYSSTGSPYTGNVHASLYKDEGPLPGTLVATSVNTETVPPGGYKTFTFPPGTTLEDQVCYNIVFWVEGKAKLYLASEYWLVGTEIQQIYDGSWIVGNTDGPNGISSNFAMTVDILSPSYDALARAAIPKDCTGKNKLKFAVKSHITGNPIEFKYGVDGYGEFTSLPAEVTINQADTWEVKTIDISQLTDAQKAGLKYWSLNWGTDAFDSTTGESKQNTIYIDELTAE